MSGTMRRYLRITEKFGPEDYSYDEFGAAMPLGSPQRVMTKVVPTDVPDAPQADVPDGAYAAESRDMVLRLLVKIERHVQALVPSMIERGEPVEPWVQDKLSQAAEALESVADYTASAVSEARRRR